jgi:hypothetical protein
MEFFGNWESGKTEICWGVLFLVWFGNGLWPGSDIGCLYVYCSYMYAAHSAAAVDPAAAAWVIL